MLEKEGYECRFSTLFDRGKTDFEQQRTLKVQYHAYLQYLAQSSYCLAFTHMNEGWNRIVHESILLGTSVIGFEKGGLGNLLTESGSTIVADAQEAFDYIVANEAVKRTPNDVFIEKYETKNASFFLNPILDFIEPKHQKT